MSFLLHAQGSPRPGIAWNLRMLFVLGTQRSPDLLSQEGKVRGPMLPNILQLLESVWKRLNNDEAWPAWFCDMAKRCACSETGMRPSFKEIVMDANW